MKNSIKIAIGGIVLTVGAIGVGIAIGRKTEPNSLRATSASQAQGTGNVSASAGNVSVKGGKANKPSGNSGGNAGGAADVAAYADELCESYCTKYFDSCANWNIYLYPKGKSSAVAGITTQETELPRKDNAQRLAEARTDCLETCMTWPRPIDPATFPSGKAQAESQDPKWDPLDPFHFYFNSRGGGDTYWCRANHLSLSTDPNSAGFHCGHGTNPALGICRDALVDGYTPYEWLRNGADTQHRQPYCDFANEGKVADCTMGGVTDSNLVTVLSLLPRTVRILFLNGNAITTLGNAVFKNNVPNYEILKAIYINDNGLTTIDPNALEGLVNLEVFNADSNQVENLDKDLLKDTTKLKQFSMFENRGLFGATGRIPAGFFQHTPNLEVMSLYGTAINNFPVGTFDGLTKLTMMSFVTNGGITTASFETPYNRLFSDLLSLQFFDFFGNNIDTIPENFFGSWAQNILRLAFWNCPITSIHPNAGLQNLDSIEMAYFHEQTGGPPFEGGSFAIKPVRDILISKNEYVTITYGNVADVSPIEPQPIGPEL